MNFVKSKKAAMEMSVGTIVTIVLLMTVLILGLVLVGDIFKSANGTIKLSDKELQNQLSQAFGSETSKSVIYPTSNNVEIKPGKEDEFGIGIRNVVSSFEEGTSFHYEVVYNKDTCNLGKEKAMSLLSAGSTGDVVVPKNDLKSDRIYFSIPSHYPICKVNYNVLIYRGDATVVGSEYDTQLIQIDIK